MRLTPYADLGLRTVKVLQHGFRRAENLVRALQLELASLGRVFGFTPADVVPPIEIDNASALA